MKQYTRFKLCLLLRLLIWIIVIPADLSATEIETYSQPHLFETAGHGVKKYSYSMIALISGSVLYRLLGNNEPLDISALQSEEPELLQLLEPLSDGYKVPDGVDQEEDFLITLLSNDSIEPEKLTVQTASCSADIYLPEIENAGQYASTITGIIAYPQNEPDKQDSESDKKAEQESEADDQIHESEELSEAIPDSTVITAFANRIFYCNSNDNAVEIAKDARRYNTEKLASGELIKFQVSSSLYYKNMSLFYLACRQGYIDIVKALYHSGINLEQRSNVFPEKSNDHKTCLHIAVAQGRLEIVKFLLEKGAKVAATIRGGHCTETLCSCVTNEDIRLKLLSCLQSARRAANCPCPKQIAFIGRGQQILFREYPANILIPEICCSGQVLTEKHPAILVADFLINLVAFVERTIEKNQKSSEQIIIGLFATPDSFPETMHESSVCLAYKICSETYQVNLYIKAVMATVTLMEIIKAVGEEISKRELGFLHVKIGRH